MNEPICYANGKPLRRVECNPKKGEYAYDRETGVVTFSGLEGGMEIRFPKTMIDAAITEAPIES